MTAGLWRLLADGRVRLARGDSEEGPAELLAESLSLTGLLADPAEPLQHLESLPAAGQVPRGATTLAPLDQQPVWAAGVTFQRSREARQEEASDGGDVYDRVYTAVRPELFVKAGPGAAIGTKDELGVRADSDWNVPEPELGIVADPRGRPQAFVLGNDMSSRSIEGENPLYLPQAKVYDRSCGIGPCLVPVSLAPAWRDLRIELIIRRGGVTAYQDAMELATMRRTPDELLGWLFAANSFPAGVALLTGTSLVPPSPFSLRARDEVIVRAVGLGVLANIITVVGSVLAAAGTPATAPS
ncbi:MAG TPA: fumarylacetoacetate hydrolase family protein [Streptosporangiaceae bacterium]